MLIISTNMQSMNSTVEKTACFSVRNLIYEPLRDYRNLLKFVLAGVFDHWQLILYGTTTTPVNLRDPPERNTTIRYVFPERVADPLSDLSNDSAEAVESNSSAEAAESNSSAEAAEMEGVTATHADDFVTQYATDGGGELNVTLVREYGADPSVRDDSTTMQTIDNATQHDIYRIGTSEDDTPPLSTATTSLTSFTISTVAEQNTSPSSTVLLVCFSPFIIEFVGLCTLSK